MSDNKKVPILPILLVNFVGTFGYSIVLPFLIVLVLSLGGNELTYGVLGATYSFFQLIGAPILGRWSDNYGRKKILLLSEVGTFIGWTIFIVALLLPNQTITGSKATFVLSIPLILLFVARAVDGITGGNVSVANAYLADISAKADRKKNFGKMAAIANAGLIFGPALAGILGDTPLGNMLPVIMALAVSLLAIIVIATKLKDIQPRKIDEHIEGNDVHKVLGQEHKECYNLTEQQKHSFFSIIKLPNVLFILILYFLIFLAFNFFYVAFPVYVAGQLKWTVFQIGIFFSVLSALLVLVQGPVLTWISHYFSGSILIIAGSLMLAAGFYLFRFDTLIPIYSGLVLFAFGNGIMWPSFLAIVSNVGDGPYQGTIQGFASSAGSLASIIGLISGAFIYKFIGVNTFLLATGFMIVIAIASVKLVAVEKAT